MGEGRFKERPELNLTGHKTPRVQNPDSKKSIYAELLLSLSFLSCCKCSQDENQAVKEPIYLGFCCGIQFCFLSSWLSIERRGSRKQDIKVTARIDVRKGKNPFSAILWCL